MFANQNFAERAVLGSVMVPGDERKINDLFFIILLLALIVMLFVMSIYGLAEGHLTFMSAPVDSDGRLCGIAETIGFPNLYYYDLENNKSSTKYATCVRNCPDSGEFQFLTTDCMKTERIHDCTIPYGKGYSTETMFHYCIRKDQNIAMEAKRDVFRDFELTAPAIFICLGLGFVYTIFYLYILSRFAKQIIVFLIVMCELLLLIGFCLCIYGSGQVDYPAGAWLGALLFFVIFVVLNILLYCYRTDIGVAIAVIDASADFVVATKRLVLVTIASFAAGSIFIVLWFYGFINILSINDVKTVLNDDGNYEKQMLWNDLTRTLTAFMLIGIIWIISFLREQNMFINMYCAAEFYFTFSERQQGAANIVPAIKTTYKKHIGSVALGSLLHTLTALLRLIARQASSLSDSDNPNGAQKCLFCCCSCLDTLVEYLNQIAYAMAAITGDSYCVSAKNGFYLTQKHLETYWFAKTLSSFVMFFGQFAISLINVGSCFLLVKFAIKDSQDIDALWAPLCIIFFATVFTSELFMSIFKQSIITTLLCFAFDQELNGEAKHGPPDFHNKLKAIHDEYQNIEHEREVIKQSKLEESIRKSQLEEQGVEVPPRPAGQAGVQNRGPQPV